MLFFSSCFFISSVAVFFFFAAHMDKNLHFIMTYLINLADKVVISSVGSDNLAAETSFHHINGINGSTWSLYSRNLRVLDAFDDVYGGVVVDSDKLPANPSEFPPILRFSISHWKKMVNPLPVFRSSPT